jgi:CheY-like chemotaxis protein
MSDKRSRILIVEDEALVAMMIEDLLADLGCDVGDNPVRLEEALAAAQSGEFDMALLDLNLAGSRTYPVADVLAARGIPFAFLTGYRSEDLDAAYRAAPILAKPFRRADLQALLTQLLDNRQQA